MLTVRHIKTNDKNEPALDAAGNEVELWSVKVPADIEAEGGAAIDAYVTAERAKPASSTPVAAAATTEDASHG